MLSAAVLLAALAAGCLLLNSAMDPFGGRIAENVSVGGICLGGMTKAEARKQLPDQPRHWTPAP